MLHLISRDMGLHSVPATISYSFHQVPDFMFVLGKTIKRGPYPASVGAHHYVHNDPYSAELTLASEMV
jgi:hypothetical protein